VQGKALVAIRDTLSMPSSRGPRSGPWLFPALTRSRIRHRERRGAARGDLALATAFRKEETATPAVGRLAVTRVGTVAISTRDSPSSRHRDSLQVVIASGPQGRVAIWFCEGASPGLPQERDCHAVCHASLAAMPSAGSQ
jgi:hypothetical protein